MSRACRTCQHVKRAEIDRGLAGGEPAARLAGEYALNPSSLHRHRANCLKLASSAAIMKETAQGTAAVALLPSPESLSRAYLELRNRIEQIVVQAQQEGSLATAISGLNSVRQTLDSVARLAGAASARKQDDRDGREDAASVDVGDLAERLLHEFKNDPEIRARIAKTLLTQFEPQAIGSVQ